MVQMKFPFEIKYLGNYYQPNDVIKVKESDVEELISIGGTVIEKDCEIKEINNRKIKRVSKK